MPPPLKEQRILERADVSILDVIENRKETGKTTDTGASFLQPLYH